MDNPLILLLDGIGLLLAGTLLLAYAAMVIGAIVLAVMLGGLLLVGFGAWALDALRGAGPHCAVAGLAAVVALLLIAVHAGGM